MTGNKNGASNKDANTIKGSEMGNVPTAPSPNGAPSRSSPFSGEPVQNRVRTGAPNNNEDMANVTIPSFPENVTQAAPPVASPVYGQDYEDRFNSNDPLFVTSYRGMLTFEGASCQTVSSSANLFETALKNTTETTICPNKRTKGIRSCTAKISSIDCVGR